MLLVRVYRFLRSHRGLMWALLVGSTLFFSFFALKMRYEEDISKLVPGTGTTDSGLAFGNVKVKDKIFLQFEPDGETDQWSLGLCVDEFMEGLMAKDSLSGTIAGCLYSIPDDLPVMALGYALEHVPSLVDTAVYAAFDEALARADETMARNYELVMEDETGSATQMVATDPLGLRYALLGGSEGDPLSAISGGGFTLTDGHLFCTDGSVALAFISPEFSYQDSKSGTVLVGLIEERIGEFSSEHPEIRVHVHGAPVRSVGNSRTIKGDLLLTIGLSFLLILVIMCLSFRSMSVIWQNVAPVLYGTVFALAVMYWIKGEMSLMAFGICAVVLGVGLSYCLHVIIHQRFVGDIEKMLMDEGLPVFLGCLTTIGAFLGLLLTGSELLRDFGAFASLALAGSTFFALVFLPQLLRDGDTRKSTRAFSLAARVNGFPYDRNPFVIGAVLALVAVGFIFSPRVGFDSDLRNIGYESPEMIEAEKLYVEKNYGGLTQRFYAAAGETLDEALTANGRVASLLDSLSGEGLIRRPGSTVRLLFPTEKEQAARIAAWEAYWSPAKQLQAHKAVEAAARRHGLDPGMFGPFFSMISASYDPGDLYSEGIIPEELLCNFIEQSRDGKYMVFSAVQMPPENKAKVDALVGALPRAVVMDPMFYTGNMVEIVHKDFNTTLLISSLFVLLVLLLSFRNLWVALLAFMPMFLSWYVVQGVMALIGVEFNLINIVISTFIFGIGVDYSIFIMQGLLAGARGEGNSLLEYHKAAIIFSAMVLIIVVASLLAARHPAIRSIGVSSVIGMVSTIVLTYSLQPLLFRLMLKVPFMRRSVKARS